MAMAQRQAQAYALAQGLQVNTGTNVTHPYSCVEGGKIRAGTGANGLMRVPKRPGGRDRLHPPADEMAYQTEASVPRDKRVHDS